MDKIRVAMVGAGETGTPLLKQLLEADFVEVVMVAELNEALPGVALAKKHGVTVTSHFLDLAKQGSAVDIIIDVTGVADVREKLRHELQEAKNHHTILMHEMAAILMMSLSQGKLVEMKHGQSGY